MTRFTHLLCLALSLLVALALAAWVCVYDNVKEAA